MVSLYLDGAKYILEDIPVVLAKANQALATLDKYRSRLDQVSTRLTALEFEGGVTLHDVLTVLQRSELVTRMAVEIERYIVELGAEGRLIEMQLEETMVGVAADKAALVHDYIVEPAEESFARRARLAGAAAAPGPARLRPARRAARLRPQAQHPRPSRSRRAATASSGASRACRSWWCRASCGEFGGLDEILAATDGSWRPSRESGTCGRRRSARAFAACRRSTSWTDICKPDANSGASTRRT